MIQNYWIIILRLAAMAIPEQQKIKRVCASTPSSCPGIVFVSNPPASAGGCLVDY